MLIEDGKINPRLLPDASSRKVRNAVGISGDGKVVFMLSKKPIRFYDFACYAQSQLDVRQMLYLDGTISAMYRKGESIPWQYHPFVTLTNRRAPRRSDLIIQRCLFRLHRLALDFVDGQPGVA